MRKKMRTLLCLALSLAVISASALPLWASDSVEVTFQNNKTTVHSESQLRNAIAKAGAWEVVEVGIPLMLYEPIVVPSGKSLTLSGQSLRWYGEGYDSLLVVESGGKLTLKAATLDGRNGIGIAYVHSGGELVIDEQSVLKRGYNEKSGGGVYNNGTVTMKGGSIYECAAGQGGGVYNVGKFFFERGSIMDNIAETGNGGGMYNAGSLAMRNGNFSNNAAEGVGLGLYHGEKAPLLEMLEHPAISDGFYLGGGKTVKLSVAGLDVGATLRFEGMDKAKSGRVVVSGADDDDLKGFQVTPEFPWRLERSGSNLVLAPETD